MLVNDRTCGFSLRCKMRMCARACVHIHGLRTQQMMLDNGSRIPPRKSSVTWRLTEREREREKERGRQIICMQVLQVNLYMHADIHMHLYCLSKVYVVALYRSAADRCLYYRIIFVPFLTVF